jgi:MFS transporter, Spinster family, sphingosine-1-phosphate transporter
MHTTPNLTESYRPDQNSIKIPQYSYYALGILTLVNFLNYIDRQVLPAVAPSMLRDANLKLTYSEIGYMESALLLSFTILAPIFGYLGDRYSRTRLIAVAAVIWSVATAITGLIDRFIPGTSVIQQIIPILNITFTISGVGLALCFVRSLVGIGESAYSTIAPSLIADYFPAQKRATALGIFYAAIPMGFALGYVIGGLLAYYFGWRTAFMIVGIPGIITALFIWRLREPVRGSSDDPVQDIDKTISSVEEKPKFIKSAWKIISTRDWTLATAGYTASVFTLGAFATWATVLLVEDKGLSEDRANILLGLIILVSGTIGTFGGGWFADRLATKVRSPYFLICGFGSLLSIVPAILALNSNSQMIYMPAIFFTVLLLFVGNAPINTIVINSVPMSMRATAVALNIVAIHTFGDAISRSTVGIIADSLKEGGLTSISSFASSIGIESNQYLSAAMLITPVALLISAIFFFWGANQTGYKEN